MGWGRGLSALGCFFFGLVCFLWGFFWCGFLVGGGGGFLWVVFFRQRKQQKLFRGF